MTNQLQGPHDTLSQKTVTRVPEPQMRIETFVWILEVGRPTYIHFLNKLSCTVDYLSTESYLSLNYPDEGILIISSINVFCPSKEQEPLKPPQHLSDLQGCTLSMVRLYSPMSHTVPGLSTGGSYWWVSPCMAPLLGHNGANMAFSSHTIQFPTSNTRWNCWCCMAAIQLKQKHAASLSRPSISAPFCKGGFSLHATHPQPSSNERTTRK